MGYRFQRSNLTAVTISGRLVTVEQTNSHPHNIGHVIMAQTDATKLDVGDRFPTTLIQVINAPDPQRLPEDLTAEYTIFLVYRGKW